MSLKYVIATGFLATLAFAGCAKDTPAGHAADEIDKASQESMLKSGKFESSCSTSNLVWKLGGANSQNEVFDFKVTSGDAGRTIQYFASGDCTGNTIGTATYTGTQAIGPEIADGSARTLDLNYQSVVVTISDQKLVDALNSVLVPSCDFNQWKVGEGHDVTASAGGATCLAVPKPAQVFDIVHTDGQTTQFGDKTTGSGLTQDARPTKLDQNGYHKI